MPKLQVGSIPIVPENNENAEAGHVVALSKDGRLVLRDPSYIAENAEKAAEEAKSAVSRFDAFTRHVKHFKTICVSHFANAFLLWKLRVITGEEGFDGDQSLLTADQRVLSGEQSVRDALEENKCLRDIFVAIYGEYADEDDASPDIKVFPEV